MDPPIIVTGYASVASVVVALLVRQLIVCCFPEACIEAPLIPNFMGKCASVGLTVLGVANLGLQVAVFAPNKDSTDVVVVLLVAYNFFSVLWIGACFVDAAAVPVVIGAVFAVAALVTQSLFKIYALPTLFLAIISALAIVDVIVYAVIAPKRARAENERKNNRVDKLKNELLKVQSDIDSILQGEDTTSSPPKK